MLTFELVTLGGVKFDGEVYEVILPTPEGLIAVFANHASLVSITIPGVVSIRKHKQDSDNKMEHFAIHGGVVEVNKRRVRLLADEATHSDEVVHDEIKSALELAKKMKKSAKDQVSFEKAQSLIEIYNAKLRVASLKKRHHR